MSFRPYLPYHVIRYGDEFSFLASHRDEILCRITIPINVAKNANRMHIPKLIYLPSPNTSRNSAPLRAVESREVVTLRDSRIQQISRFLYVGIKSFRAVRSRKSKHKVNNLRMQKHEKGLKIKFKVLKV